MDDTRYKTFWRRTGAALVDAIATSPVNLLVSLLAAVAVAPVSDRAALATSVVASGVSLVYAPYCHARWGQTMGKMACGVRVVPSGLESGRISVGQAIVRELPNVLLFLLIAGGFIGAVVSDNAELIRFRDDGSLDFNRNAVAWLGAIAAINVVWLLAEAATMALNARRRSIHDFLAGTVVVKSGYSEQPWPRVYDDQIVFPAVAPVPASPGAPAFAGSPSISDVHPRFRAGWERLGAAVIDGILFMTCWIVPSSILFFSIDNDSLNSLTAAIGAAGYAIYDVTLHARGGKTVGKMALGITVVDAGTLGPISWRQAWLRSTGLWLGVAVALVSAATLASFGAPSGVDFSQRYGFFAGANQWDLAALIVMLVSPQRRALHDLVAGTAVVKDSYMREFAYVPGSGSGLPPAYATESRPGW